MKFWIYTQLTHTGGYNNIYLHPICSAFYSNRRGDDDEYTTTTTEYCCRCCHSMITNRTLSAHIASSHDFHSQIIIIITMTIFYIFHSYSFSPDMLNGCAFVCVSMWTEHTYIRVYLKERSVASKTFMCSWEHDSYEDYAGTCAQRTIKGYKYTQTFLSIRSIHNLYYALCPNNNVPFILDYLNYYLNVLVNQYRIS